MEGSSEYLRTLNNEGFIGFVKIKDTVFMMDSKSQKIIS